MAGSWGHFPHKLLVVELALTGSGGTQVKTICFIFEL